jgi:hypothetical protein
VNAVPAALDSVPTMTAQEWLKAFAARLGVDPPTPDELRVLLDLAGEAAHTSERIAAPVACWLSARAGRSPAEALAIARKLGGATKDD